MHLGNYDLNRLLAIGGMGEVYLAYDRVLKRQVALKRIKESLSSYPISRERFLREAHVASKLCHPSIVPIYAIHEENDLPYYTMPYIQGQTLKQIIRAPNHPLRSSINTLIRIFLSVCQAVAYAHSKKILHRDLKPENIIVGDFGEVMLLDWGLADDLETKLDIEESENIRLTRAGKIVGTLSHMAPERAKDLPCTEQTEIFALGVILYQLLTRKLPFQRGSISRFKKIVGKEELLPPKEMSPDLDIPERLSRICLKCLSPSSEARYLTVSELLKDIEDYLQGNPDWHYEKTLDIRKKSDWEFQAYVPISKHIAISNGEVLWMTQMLSQDPFPVHLRIETAFSFSAKSKEESQGFGLLLAVAEPAQRKTLEEGYMVFISPSKGGCLKIYRNNVLVFENLEVGIESGKRCTLSVEKSHRHLRVHIDGQMACHYISQIPLSNPHIGVIYLDAHADIAPMQIHVGTKNVTVSCLAIPDALLEEGLFEKALIEYRRIARAFAGRKEGKDALFRSGIALLQWGLSKKKKIEREKLFEESLLEFRKLHKTNGEIFEYLGKSLVYKEWKKSEEEMKCLELAIRKFPKHPSFNVLVEQLIYRLYESRFSDRKVHFASALLSATQIQEILLHKDHHNLRESIELAAKNLPFLEELSVFASEGSKLLNLAVALSFWLKKEHPLREILENEGMQKPEHKTIKSSAVLALFLMGKKALAKSFKIHLPHFECLIKKPDEGIIKLLDESGSHLNFNEERILFHLFDQALLKESVETLSTLSSSVEKHGLSLNGIKRFEECKGWICLLKGEKEIKIKSPSPLLAYASSNKELASKEPFALYLKGELDLKSWKKKAFAYEFDTLQNQLILLKRIHLVGNGTK